MNSARSPLASSARRRALSPLLFDLKRASRSSLVSDMGAGVASAVLLVPQGMAYALLAGLPPVVGLYAALVAPLCYGLLGSSRQLSVGPVAMDSLLVAATLGSIASVGQGLYLEAAITLSVMVGTLQLLMGLLRMGFFVNFLSHPVISGFTSATALLIALSQLRPLSGLELHNAPNLGGYLLQLPTLKWSLEPQLVLLGALGVIALWLSKKWLPRFVAPLSVIALLTALVHGLGWGSRVPLVGQVPEGLPSWAWSRVSWSLMRELLPGALTLATLGFVESISIAKSYALKEKVTVSDNRELVALGWANLMSGFLGAYPVAGGFSRTAVNHASGARTQLSTLIASAFVLMALLLLAPVLSLVPTVALAAIILSSVTSLIDLGEFRRLQKVKPTDRWLLGVTFLATLIWGMVPGVATGVVASLMWQVARSARPHLAVLGRVPGTHLFRNVRRHRGLHTYRGVLIVRMDAEFYFGNVQFLRDALLDLEYQLGEELEALVFDASAVNDIDSSAELALRQLNEEYSTRGVQFYVTGLKGPVLDVLRSSGLAQELGNRGRCMSVHEAVISLNATPHRLTSGTEGQIPPLGASTAQESELMEPDGSNRSRRCSGL